MQNHQSTAATYTTIPISASDVISRSLHSLLPHPPLASTPGLRFPILLPTPLLSLSRHLQPPLFPIQLLCRGRRHLFTVPHRFPALFPPLLRHLRSLAPPLLLLQRGPTRAVGPVSDRLVLFSLAFLSVLAVWVCGVLQNLALRLGIGVLICGVHALVRNSDGLFLDENDAISTGLVRSAAATSTSATPPPN